MILTKTLISTTSQDPQVQQLMTDIQGNILKSHGRQNVSLLFLNFTGPPEDNKLWLGDKMSPLVTSMAAQLSHLSKRRLADDKTVFDAADPGFVGFSLSSTGYEKLGLSGPLDSRFTSNAKLRTDPPLADWESEFREKPDALVVLGISNENQIDTFESSILSKILSQEVSLKHKERGKALLVADGTHIEHFGYADGVSQPRFFKEDLENKAPTRVNNDPSASLGLVLLKDPNGKAFSGDEDRIATDLNGSHSFGSLVAFRKLHQDLAQWNNAVVAASQDLNPGNANPFLVGAQLVGRFKDGTPLIQASSEQNPDPKNIPNDFNYKEPASESKCPFAAHIRKSNPRGGRGDDNRRIARRGVPYGNPTDEDKGLLFMSYQANISSQVDFIQQSWSDNPNFSKGDVGIDGVTGQKGGRADLPDREFFTEHGNLDSSKKTSFDQFVTLKGAAYFFTPSMSFLTSFKTIDDTSTGDGTDDKAVSGLGIEVIIAIVVAIVALVFFLK